MQQRRTVPSGGPTLEGVGTEVPPTGALANTPQVLGSGRRRDVRERDCPLRLKPLLQAQRRVALSRRRARLQR